MDTIEIRLNLKKGLELDTINKLRTVITSLISEYNHRYCDVLEISPKGDLIVKISYPRYFAGTNACLIESRNDCIRVQTHFINSIFSDVHWRNIIEDITLTRVDIPFTY